MFLYVFICFLCLEECVFLVLVASCCLFFFMIRVLFVCFLLVFSGVYWVSMHFERSRYYEHKGT